MLMKGYNNSDAARAQGSIVNNGQMYTYAPCYTMEKPNYFVMLGKGDNSALTLANSLIKATGCTSQGKTLEIAFKSIQSNVQVLSSTEAAKQKITFTVDKTKIDCNAKLIGFTIEKRQNDCSADANVYNVYVPLVKTCEDDTQTNATLAAELAARAVQTPDYPVTVTVNPENTAQVIVEAKTAGEGFYVQGFENLTYALVTANSAETLKGKNLGDFGIVSCGTVADNASLKVILLQIKEDVQLDIHFYGDSNYSSESGSYVGALKTVAFISDGTHAANVQYNTLATILAGGFSPASEYYAVSDTITPLPTTTAGA